MKKMLSMLVAMLVLPALVVMGCQAEAAGDAAMPPLDGGPEAQIIELSVNDFASQKHFVKEVELVSPGSLIVRLGANPTTGFQWGAAEISAPALISEQSYVYVPPQSGEPVIGAPGTSVWVFDSLQTGNSSIKFSYGRNWEGGEKDVWTLTLNVVIK